ncbi:MAG: methyltransferase family protein [Novosphingobium sp.]
MSASEPKVPQRPASDVSAAVGLWGVTGLALWICFCHFWPEISAALGAAEPQERLSGPYAGLAGLVAAALPMVLVSLIKDKVHRRASTGIDWDSPRPVTAIIDISITKLAGLWATWAVIGGLYCVARWYWDGPYLLSMQVLGTLASPLFVISIPFVIWLDRVLVEPRDGAWHFGALLIGREPVEPEQVWHHARAWAVKGFFTAFMISIVPGGFGILVENDWAPQLSNPVALAGLLITAMFVLDAQIGTVGYIMTMKPLDAQIRSANPFLAGWLAALICYPPFQLMQGNGPLYYQTNTQNWAYWLEGYNAVLWVWAAVLVFLAAIYAWATVAFGLRFSNLTYRGVLTNGPYRFTKHPAYLAKNAFWWLEVLPFLVVSHSFTDMVRNTFFLACVSAIYFWRAKTEEAHLLAEDPKYRAYADWMAQHGLITRLFHRAGIALRGRRQVLQPAE